ncbi:MAG: tetratricopeptide repeat protein [Phycisphaerae bacterium]|nr:tetratricopeptide repeat protein [Phycisphaerae bacterium]
MRQHGLQTPNERMVRAPTKACHVRRITGRIAGRNSPACRLSRAALIAVVAVLASGCQRTTANLLDPLHRSIARQQVKRAQHSLDKGDHDGAAKALQSATAHDPQNAAAHAELGHFYAEAGKLEEAIHHYRSAVKAAPDKLDHVLDLARTLQRQAATSMDRPEILDAALRAYRHARWLDPDNLDAAVGLGSCYVQLGMFDLALAQLQDAKTIDPTAAVVNTELATLHTERAAAYFAEADYASALAEYRRALDFAPDNCTAHNGCGKVNLQISRQGGPKQLLARERALAHLRKSLQVNPDQPRIEAVIDNARPAQRRFAEVVDHEGD